MDDHTFNTDKESAVKKRSLFSQVIESFFIAVMLVCILWWWNNTSFDFALEGTFLKLASVVRYSLTTEKNNTNNALLINVATAGTFIASDDGIGNRTVSDRSKIAKFIREINAYKNPNRIIICDLLFDDITPLDSELAKTIQTAPNVYFPSCQKESNPLIYSQILPARSGYVDYDIYSSFWKFSDCFLKFPLMKDTQISLPLRIYEQQTQAKIQRKYGLLWIDGIPYTNTIPIDENIRSYSLQSNSDSITKSKLMGLDAVLEYFSFKGSPYYDSLLATYGKKDIIIIGDFDNDKHKTAFGDVAGSLIVYNILTSLYKNENSIHFYWVLFLIVSFTGIIHYTLFGESKNVRTNLKIVDSLLGVIFGTFTWHLLLFSVVFICSYFILQTGIELIAASFFLTLLLGIRKSIYRLIELKKQKKTLNPQEKILFIIKE